MPPLPEVRRFGQLSSWRCDQELLSWRFALPRIGCQSYSPSRFCIGKRLNKAPRASCWASELLRNPNPLAPARQARENDQNWIESQERSRIRETIMNCLIPVIIAFLLGYALATPTQRLSKRTQLLIGLVLGVVALLLLGIAVYLLLT